MDNSKLIDIETKLAHQEHLLAELNDVMTFQQGQISALESLCKSLIERVRDLSESGPGTDDDRPPHY